MRHKRRTLLFGFGAVLALFPTLFFARLPKADSHPSAPPIALARSGTQPPAQEPPPGPPPHIPRLLIPEADGKTRPLALAKADIAVSIAGPLARTTMTLTFKNDQARVLEGELEFPLPEGTTISGYGLDINGEMVDGVPVPKEKARIAFESEVRKGVDPGIAEATEGNNFRTRVYPIPANGTRTVKVEYVTDLAAFGNDLAYELPLRWGQQVPFATLKIEVAENVEKPVVKWAGRESELPFEKVGERFVAEKNFEQADFNDDLTLRLPGLAAKGASLVERFTRASSTNPEHFFLVTDPVAAPTSLPSPARTPDPTIGIVWDASLSRQDADHKREIALLRAYLKSVGLAMVDLYILRNDVEPKGKFSVVSGQADALIDTIQKVTYDGGTNLGEVHLTKANKDRPYACWLFFTDGLGNLGQPMPAEIAAPVYTIAADSRANHPLLRYIATKSGGAYLNLNRLTDEQATATLGRQPYSLLSVTVNEGRVADIFPNASQPVYDRAMVTGRLLTDTATLTLNYGANGKVLAKKTVTLSRANETETGLAARYWASQRVASLAVFPEENGESLLALGRDFNIVTPNTSLIVLDTLDQYVRYGITPPKTRTKMYADYLAAMRTRSEVEIRENRSKLDAVLAQWNDRKTWWNTPFRYAKNFRYKQAGGMKDGGEESDTRATGLGAAGRRGRGGDGYDRSPAAEAPRPQPTAPPAAGGGAAGGFGGPPAGFSGGAPATRSANRAARRPAAVARESEKKAKADADDEEAAPAANIVVKDWSPDTPYLKKMKAAPGNAYAVYLEQRKEYAASPAFYLDCSEYFLSHGDTTDGLRALTNIAELRLEDPQLLRIVAHRLGQIGYRNLAITLFEKVLRLRPEEPQSFRDLALTLADRADAEAAKDPKAALADYRRAVEVLGKVVMERWDRFEGIESIALMEANRIIPRMRGLPGGETVPVPLDSRLIGDLPCDVRILLTWDTDETDMDLWVTEPSGETAIYSHPRTTIGGRMSKDFTQGYGPEEYCLRTAMPGAYRIQTNYYGSSQQRLTGGTTVQATIITNFGRPTEKRRTLTVRLTQEKNTVDLGKITW